MCACARERVCVCVSVRERERKREREERTGFIIISVHATYYDCASMISLIQFSMRACGACGVCVCEREREGESLA